MKTFRIILGILAIIPIGLMVASIADPKMTAQNSNMEMIFLLVGVPILVLNLWAWDAPQIIKKLFGVKE
jgi:hypothetical protein